MGFNKRIISLEKSLFFLKNEGLKNYYGKSDVLFFIDPESSEIYQMFQNGLKEKDILEIILKKIKHKKNEVY